MAIISECFMMKGPRAIFGSFLVLILLSLAACVQAPSRMATQPREAGEVIDLRIGYPEAFDRVVRALEREGYEIDAADERVGVIRTVPKAREGAGGVAYKVVVMVRMGGTDRESWLAVDQVAIPTFPEDEGRVKEILKGIDR